MEFKIPKKEHWNLQKYGKEEFDLSRKLADSLIKEMPGFLQTVVLFGSSARGEKTTYEKDIDVLLIVNDVSIILTPEVSETFRIITEKISSQISRRFHLNTLMLSSYWEYVRNGDPIIINMLRDGVPLYDIGVFEPMQQLLFKGKIKPSSEAMWIYWARAPNTIQNAKWHVMQAMVDLYWAAIDAAHAALMRAGEIPPTPSHVPDMLDQKFVKAGLLEAKYVGVIRDLFKMAKMIAHRDIKEVTGEAFSKAAKETLDFVERMKKIVES